LVVVGSREIPSSSYERHLNEGVERASKHDGSRSPTGGAYAMNDARPPSSPTPDEPRKPAAPAATPAELELQRFAARLHALTPRLWIVPALILANLGVFIAMIASGVSPMEPTTEELIRFGANAGPLTHGGEWWRLVSATFVHVGVVHILLNMYSLWAVGRVVERLMGTSSFAVLYFAAGIAGSIASIAVKPLVVSAGASGAVFGVFGALGGIALRLRHELPKPFLKSLWQDALVVVGANLIFTFTATGIDAGAHLGGLGAGFFASLALALPPTADASRLRRKRAIITFAAAAVVLVGAVMLLPRSGLRAIRVFDEAATVEKRMVETYNDATSRMRKGELTQNAFADLLERELVPSWHQTAAKLEAERDLPPKLVERRDALVKYMRARADAWKALGEGLRRDDASAVVEAMRKNRAAEEVLKTHSEAAK
jgi:rhomboid protease GluP